MKLNKYLLIGLILIGCNDYSDHDRSPDDDGGATSIAETTTNVGGSIAAAGGSSAVAFAAVPDKPAVVECLMSDVCIVDDICTNTYYYYGETIIKNYKCVTGVWRRL